MPAKQPRIKNWTSELPVGASIDIIQRALVQHKARRISFDHDDEGEPAGIAFELVLSGRRFAFQMPLRFEGVRAKVLEAYGGSGISPERLEAQARRTAWANIKDWVLAQMALIDAGSVKLEEVFFPYLLEGDRTAFEVFEERLLLPSQSSRHTESARCRNEDEDAAVRRDGLGSRGHRRSLPVLPARRGQPHRVGRGRHGVPHSEPLSVMPALRDHLAGVAPALSRPAQHPGHPPHRARTLHEASQARSVLGGRRHAVLR